MSAKVAVLLSVPAAIPSPFAAALNSSFDVFFFEKHSILLYYLQTAIYGYYSYTRSVSHSHGILLPLMYRVTNICLFRSASSGAGRLHHIYTYVAMPVIVVCLIR